MAKEDHPLLRAWLFLLGSTFALIVLALVLEPLLIHSFEITHKKNTVSALIDIILGIVLIFLAIFSRRRQKLNTSKTKSPWIMLLAGFLFMILFDVTTLVCYVAVLKKIIDADLSIMNNIIILLISILIIMSTMTLPVLLAALMPQKSAKILSALHNFVAKHGKTFSKLVIILIALYLIYQGLIFFI